MNKPGSEKETWHIDIDLAGTDLDYAVGDCLGIFPANDPDLVEAVLAALDAPPDFPIGGRTLREVLTDGVALSPAPDMLFQLISYLTGGERKQKARRLAAGEDPDGDAAPSTCSRRCRSFPAYARTPKPSSSRSIRCSRASIRSPLRSSRIPAAFRSPSMRCATRSTSARALAFASTFLGGRVAPGDKTQGLRAEGAAFRAAGGPVETDHHDRPRHRHRAIPCLPA